ncbi:PAS domain-containing sensor histidine kinase [Halostella sp. PRR32]|uniref:PAS domain-containing sensor histidine kinase n=1 Tax=Halostella sp. PRR32 TaxID=3098147 RepID=UPI002B1E6A8E|nr:PAS domain-containing sensor histidine kinase [Halostella sp. PRR32]
MALSEQRLLVVGNERVADGVAAAVDRSVTVDDTAEARAELDAGRFDGVLVENGVDGATDLIRSLATADDAPGVLFVTDGEEGVDEALHAGATDYFRVDDPPRVARGRVRDITTSRAARDRELERYRTLVETAGDAMYALDEKGRITMVNETHVEFTNKSREALIGSHPGERIGDDAVAEAKSLIGEILSDDDRKRGRLEFAIADADGELRQYEDNLAVLTDDNGELTGSVGVIRDISDRKRRERELARYRTLVEAVGDPMYILDEEGVVTMANEAMAEHLDYDRADIVGTHTSEFVGDGDYERGTELLRDLYEDDERDWGTYEMESVTANDERILTENNVAVLTDDGNYAGSVGVIRDISERKRRIEALRGQNERLDEFASVVGHDLRNPLNVIQGHLDLARKTGEAEHFDAICEGVDRMEDLLDELLALARQGKVVSDPETVSLVEVSRNAWDGVATGDATLELPDGDPTVEADGTRLRELFENLFRNTVEHAGPDATVRVGTTGAGFYVEDDGPGIPVSDSERVFDRGYTTADDGTGLGLNIVKRIAEGHGWSVSATVSGDGDRTDTARLLRGSGDTSDRERDSETGRHATTGGTALDGDAGGTHRMQSGGGARFEFRTTVTRR